METQNCPKCGFQREPKALDCPVCGIVYAKFERGSPARPAPAAPGPAAAPFEEPNFYAAPPPLPVNPYAAPQGTLYGGSPTMPQSGFQGVWRSGDVLVVDKGSQLPGRCVVCNQATSFRWQKTYSWAPVWVRLLIIVQFVIYLIVYLSVRKQATLAIPLCQEHEDRRKRDTALSWLLILGGMATMFGSIAAANSSDLLLAMIFLGLFGLVAGVVFSAKASVLQPARIDDRYCWLKKGSPEYLAALPQAPAGL